MSTHHVKKVGADRDLAQLGLAAVLGLIGLIGLVTLWDTSRLTPASPG